METPQENSEPESKHPGTGITQIPAQAFSILILGLLFLAVYSGFVIRQGIVIPLALGITLLLIPFRLLYPKRISIIQILLVVFAVLDIPTAAAGYIFFPRPGALFAGILLVVLAVLVLKRVLTPWRGMAIWFVGVVFLGLVGLYIYRNSVLPGDCSSVRDLPPGAEWVTRSFHPYDVGFDAGEQVALVSFGQSGRLELFSTKDLKPVAAINTGLSPQRFVFDPDFNRFLVPLRGDNYLVLVELSGSNVSRRLVRIPLCSDAFAAGIDPVAGRYMVLCETSRNVVFLDRNSLTPVGGIYIGGLDLYGLLVSPKTRSAYVTDWLGSALTRIDLDKMSISRRARIGFSSFEMAMTADGAKLFVARPLRSLIQELDARTLEVRNEFKAGFGVRDIVLDEENGRLIAGDYIAGTVDIISISSGERIQRLRIGRLLRGIGYRRSTCELFVAVVCGVVRFPVQGPCGTGLSSTAGNTGKEHE